MTRAEKETIITFNEAEDVANVYTHNGKMKRVMSVSANIT